MKKFRLLRADEIECRVQKCTEKGVSLLLYKTARTDADLLDETVGTDNWENDFKLVDGVLYGGIGVNYGSGLVWKWDAGTESNTEAEKGRASDAFKRAGFKHGIGRELYSAPFVWIEAQACRKLKQDQKGRWVCGDQFTVNRIEYDERESICLLEISSGGRGVYFFRNGEKTNSGTAAPDVCECCGKPLKKVLFRGNEMSANEFVRYTKEVYGKALCVKCIRDVEAGR